MYLRRFNTQVLVLWTCLAATVSAIAMTFMTKDLMLDSLAISVSVLTLLGVIFSGSLLLTEHIIKTCNS